MMIDTGLRHKVVCITGTNNPTGIGAAVARAFAAQGAAVFLHYFRQRGTHSETEIPDRPGKAYYEHAQTLSPDHLVTELRENGSMIDAWECDLLDASAASALIARVEQTFRSIDVLVNNAALCEPDTFKPLVGSGSKTRAANTFPTNVISAEAHNRHFAVNTRAPALLMAEFAASTHPTASIGDGLSTSVATGRPVVRMRCLIGPASTH
jgi:3-oxoacyl-[acyl-carrier protein] reductase